MSQTTPPASAWTQTLPIPTWLGVVLLVAIGPADTLAARLVPAESTLELSRELRELSIKVDDLSEQVEEMRSDDRDISRILQELLSRREED